MLAWSTKKKATKMRKWERLQWIVEAMQRRRRRMIASKIKWESFSEGCLKEKFSYMIKKLMFPGKIYI
jgi:hypothetical protein